MNVIVIDDDLYVLKTIKAMLERLGHLAIVVESKKQTVKILNERNDIDIVITDVFMPDKDGIEIIMLVKRNYSNIKIIVMSGGCRYGSALEYLTMASKLGAHTTLEKPLTLNQLETAIECTMKHNEEV